MVSRLKAYYNRLIPGCVTLCYHRVGESSVDRWQNMVSVDNFREHIKILSRYYLPLSMSQLVQSLKAGRLPDRRTVVVTFDDGYACNLRYACDILSENNLPAIFYLCTTALESEEYFWWDKLHHLLVDNPAVPDSFIVPGFSNQIDFPYATGPQKEHSFHILHRWLKGLESDDRSGVLEQLSKRVNGHYTIIEEREPLTSKQIQTLASDKMFEIGGHTHSHSALALLPPEKQRFEIQENKKILEAIIGEPLSHFSYPFGGKGDFDENTIRIIKETGFESAVTTARTAFRLGGDLYAIPRMSVKNWHAAKFRNNVEELWAR